MRIQTHSKLTIHVNSALEPLIGTVTEKRTLIGMLVWAIQEKFETNSVRDKNRNSQLKNKLIFSNLKRWSPDLRR